MNKGNGLGTYNSPLLNPVKKPFDELCEGHKKFILAFLKTGDFLESYYLAGYKGGKSAARANARSLFLKLKSHIALQVDARIGAQVPLALNVYEMILREDSPATLALKAKVAADVLTRAGHAQAQEIKIIDEREPGDMSTDKIKEELESILNGNEEVKGLGLQLINGGKS